MEAREDNEPPLKRTKVPFSDFDKLVEKTPHTETEFACSGDLMTRTLSSQEDEETVGARGVIKKHEFIKIITRALYSLGYDKTGALLEEESGVPRHPLVVSLFMQQVIDGRWDDSLVTLKSISLLDETAVKSASFMLLEQKLMEYLREDNFMEALGILRNEIVPLSINFGRVNELAACILCPTLWVTAGIQSQENSISNSRSKLLVEIQNLLPASVLTPERRLEHLVEQALDVQRDTCTFHNTLDSELSLYTDHQCGRDHIPSRTSQILWAHKDEVWFVQFSHDGKYLVSSSKDQSAIIWEVKDDGQMFVKHILSGHQKPVLSASWSPDDLQLLTCGVEEVVRRWDVKTGECLNVYERAGIGLVSCGWFPDGKGIVSGMTDKSICLWSLDGRELECWKGQRTVNISDMAITDDGKKIISICRDTAILLFDREAKLERVLEEEQVITSFSLSSDNKFLLINLINQEIHLWNIEENPKIVSTFKGHKRTRFLIRSCFGGFEQTFIASGSEDSQVYIWHRSTGELLANLPGHSAAVNCVSWNPKNPHMLASASDDSSIRIWGLNDLKCKVVSGNGILHKSNGKTCNSC